MAGIGFTLRRLLGKQGLGGPLAAFAYAVTISAGPWLTSALALGVLSIYSGLGVGGHDSEVFLTIISHSFLGSLVGTGAIHMVASRYLADRLYVNDLAPFPSAYVAMMVPLWIVQGCVAAFFLHHTPLPFPVEAIAWTLYMALNGTWLAMAFLSAAHDYRSIAWGFIVGYAISLIAGYYGSRWDGLAGQLGGFTLGVVFTLGVLLFRLEREFGPPEVPAVGLGGYFKRYRTLVLVGLTYNLAIWIDKVLFWWHPHTEHPVAGWLHATPVYDNAMFLAFATILPGLGLFLMKVETDFYDAYRDYFAAIGNRSSLSTLLEAKEALAKATREAFGLLLKVQGSITLMVALLAPEILQVFGGSWLDPYVFRWGALGGLFQLMHQTCMILLLYFDDRKRALGVAVCFLLTNTLCTMGAFAYGPPAYGFGYVLSGMITLCFGLFLLGQCMTRLETLVFMRQPL